MTILLSPTGKIFTINGKIALKAASGENCCCDVCCCERMYHVTPFRARLTMGCIAGDPCQGDTVVIDLPGANGYWDGYVTDWYCINPQSQLPIHVEVSCGPFPEIDPRPTTPECRHPFGTKFWLRVTPAGQEGLTDWIAVNDQPPGVADCVGDTFYSRWGNVADFPTGCTLSPGNVDFIEVFYP